MTNLDQLVNQFKNKNHNAFEKLYVMYHKSIHGIIFTIVKNNELAAELTQDVFVKAWKNADKYSERKGRFFTWLLNIAKNTAIDEVRSKSFKNSKKNLSSNIVLETIKSNNQSDEMADTIGIKSLVEKLEYSKRMVIELLYLKGYTQKETSEALNIPLGTVKTRNRNGLKMLKLLLM